MLPPGTRRLGRWLWLLAPLFLFRAGSGSGKDLSFSGYLESVGAESLAIRLSDRRVICARLPKNAALSANALAARYRMGDEVELTCKSIQPAWEKDISRYQYLEVTALRLVERPDADKLAEVLGSIPFHEGENRLNSADIVEPAIENGNVPGGPDSAGFDRARRVNREYLAHMPNFIADETVKRYILTARSPEWSSFDTLESEVAFQGDRTVRRQVRRNGKPWDHPFEELPGFKWYGGFGSEIKPVFDPRCPVTIEFQGHAQVSARPVLDYRYGTPPDGCFPFFYYRYQRYNPARSGHVLLDESTGNVVRLEEDARGFPVEFDFAEREEEITWDSVKIGDDSHWLPVRATCVAAYYSGTRYRIETEFRNHRHFESSTSVTFH